MPITYIYKFTSEAQSHGHGLPEGLWKKIQRSIHDKNSLFGISKRMNENKEKVAKDESRIFRKRVKF